MTDERRIGSFEIFKGLSEKETEEIARLCEEIDLRDGDRIFSEGDRVEYLFILEHGSVDLRFELPYRQTSKEMTLVTLKPGDCFGWSSLVRPHKATLSCYSTEDSKAIRIRGDDLLSVSQKNNHLGFVFMQNLAAIISHRLTMQRERVIKEIGDSLRFQW